MSPKSLYATGCALALAFTMSTSAMAQLLPGLDLPGVTDPVGGVLDTVEDLLGPVDPGIGGVDVGDNGDVTATLLGDGGTPISVDPSSLLGLDIPALTITTPGDLPVDLPDLPGFPDVPTIISTVTEITGIPDLPDFPVIVDDDDGTIVYVVGKDTPLAPVIDGVPQVKTVVVDTQPRVVVLPGGSTRTVVASTNTRGNGVPGVTAKSSKLRMLLAVLQNRGWLRFTAGNGICLPPFAVTQVREMLTRREQGQLTDLIGQFAGDISTMRAMMANCSTGTRLQAGDINRVIGVGISSNGTPMLYVL